MTLTTEGRYVIEVFPSGTLGTEREVEEALTLGTVDLAFVGPGHMAQTYAPIGIHLAAFLWRDLNHFQKYPQSDTYAEVTSEYMNRSGNQILSTIPLSKKYIIAIVTVTFLLMGFHAVAHIVKGVRTAMESKSCCST